MFVKNLRSLTENVDLDGAGVVSKRVGSDDGVFPSILLFDAADDERRVVLRRLDLKAPSIFHVFSIAVPFDLRSWGSREGYL